MNGVIMSGTLYQEINIGTDIYLEQNMATDEYWRCKCTSSLKINCCYQNLERQTPYGIRWAVSIKEFFLHHILVFCCQSATQQR